jgi:hypothetical protein
MTAEIFYNSVIKIKGNNPPFIIKSCMRDYEGKVIHVENYFETNAEDYCINKLNTIINTPGYINLIATVFYVKPS